MLMGQAEEFDTVGANVSYLTFELQQLRTQEGLMNHIRVYGLECHD